MKLQYDSKVLGVTLISALLALGGFGSLYRTSATASGISDYAILFFASLFAPIIIWTWHFTTNKKEFIRKGSHRDRGFFCLSLAIISWGVLALLTIVYPGPAGEEERWRELMGSVFSTINNVFLLLFVPFLQFKKQDEPGILKHAWGGTFFRYLLDKDYPRRIGALGILVITASVLIWHFRLSFLPIYLLDVLFSLLTIVILWAFLTKIFYVRKIEILVPFVRIVLLFTAIAQVAKISSFPDLSAYDALINLSFKICLIAIFFGVILSWVYFVKNEELEEKKNELAMNSVRMSTYYSIIKHSVGNRAGRLVENIRENDELEEESKGILYSLAKEIRSTFDNLVNFSIGEVTQLEPKWEQVRLDRLDFKNHALAAERKGIIFSCDFSAAPVLYADQFFLKTILDNLIENAIKFTTEGKVEVTSEYPDEDHVLILVRDTGIGFNEKDLDNPGRLFLPYINRTTIGKHSPEKSSGEGLLQVKTLVDCMHWKIELAPNSGGGSIFKLTALRRSKTS